VLFTNTVTRLHFSYERFLENRLRESYDFFGNPIRIQIRGREEKRGDIRKTASERAPDRRSPVKKGPGSKKAFNEKTQGKKGKAARQKAKKK
jgi:hypothetical protein